MQVHQKHPIYAGCGDEVGYELGGDGHARLILAVLPGVSVIGYDGRNPAGRGSPASVDHDQKLKEIRSRGIGGLDDKDICPPDVLVNLNENLAV